ncbi:VanZ family protein [Streptomyces candidus]|uniref:Glycopeptide antibiotics resistance protein n=1 Tax=Streptomyces candidus TaxID=67283 RepID=A0A7X0HMD2_9ACTN|nr:VanZ family protein [Streptomyces candidus]MBB6440180.1 glycopeptide antibiotics resistance protein [Streptomyces candidus]GHH57672.1 hypothetical protein GCM10018773_65310 [Streptomyces candidus]
MWQIILYINPGTVTAGILTCFAACALAARFQHERCDAVTHIARLALVLSLGVVVAATLIPSQEIGTGDHSVWLVPGEGILFNNTLEGMERSMYLRQQVANAAMFLPLGICFRFAFPSVTLVKTVLAGCGLSLFIEIVQWFMNAGRVVDIDDVIVNTAGAFFGAVLCTLAKKLIRAQPASSGTRRKHRREIRR